MGHDTENGEGLGRVTPQVGPQVYGEATLDRTGRVWGIFPSGVHDGVVVLVGGGDLRLPPPEYSCIVCCR